MKLYDLRINGVEEPVGFLTDSVTVSWKVKDSCSKSAVKSRITVSDENGLLIEEREGMLESLGEVFRFGLVPRRKYFAEVTVWGDAGDRAAGKTGFTTGKAEEPWRAKWIGKQKGDTEFPVFFQRFTVPEPPKRAYLHICGLGMFEAYIDGVKVGDEYLTPLLSEYRTQQQVMTYEVTPFLRDKKEHLLEVALGEGWYMGRFGGPDGKHVFGDEMALIAELHLKAETGDERIIATDEGWQYRGSDIELSNIYDGEDLNRMLWSRRENRERRAVVLDRTTASLTDRVSLPVRAMETLAVAEVIHTPAGETVLDFGQNHSGILSFQSSLPKGTTVSFDHGEVLQNGNFYNDNYRSARARFVYTSDGRKETVRPHFTFFGYRYVRVNGWPGEVKKEDFVSLVLYSDIPQTGWFSSGNEKINRLYLNSCWGQKSNFIDMPTDCPQRDERLGWTGDAQVFCATANLHRFSKVFYDKFLRDLRNYQVREKGAVPSSIPEIGEMCLAAAVWGDAATIIPMHLYRVYKDKELLARHYRMMVDWVEYIHEKDCENKKPHYLYDFGFQWGDWLALDGTNEQSTKGGTEDAYIASVYYWNSLELTAQAARILGKTADWEKYRERAGLVRNAVLDEYFAPSGRLCLDTQTAYIISLYYGVYRKKEVVLEFLKRRLSKDNHRIRCGFVGAPLMCSVLAENGMAQEAYQILFNEEFPGWLYEVNLGATTIWERWNSLLPDGTISGTDMNSLNHYSYGSVARFLYENAAGIRRDADGYRSVIFEPLIDSRFSHISAAYESACGRYEIAWELIADDKVRVKIGVPFGCSARVRLPRFAQEEFEVTAGEYVYEYEPVSPFVSRTLEQMTAGELISHPACNEFIKSNAYPLTALVESNGDMTRGMPAKAALETAVSMCGLNPDIAAKIAELFDASVS